MNVYPVMGRPLVYLVDSRKGDGQYLCDLNELNGNGFCACPDFGCRVVANLKRPHKLLSDATLCEHLRASHLYNLCVQREIVLAQ